MPKLETESTPAFTSYPFTRSVGTKYAVRPDLLDETADDDWSAAQLLGSVPPRAEAPVRSS